MQRHHEIDRTLHVHGHQVVAGDTALEQGVGHRARTLHEVAVGQVGAGGIAADRDHVRMTLGELDEILEGVVRLISSVRATGPDRGRAGREDTAGGGELIREREVDAAQVAVGMGDQLRQNVIQPRDDCFGSGRVEQLGGVAQGSGQPLRLASEGELEIEFGVSGVDLDHIGTGRVELECGTAPIPVEQCHLEQRIAPENARWVECVDHILEGDAGVLQRSGIGVGGATQQIGEGCRRVDVESKDHGVDEHADERLEFSCATARHRDPDRDVACRRHPRHHHCECGMHCHEAGDAGTDGECIECAHDLRIDVDVDVDQRTGARIVGAAAMIARERQFVVETVEFGSPELDLSAERRCGVGQIGSQRLLPPRVVGVGQGQWREVRSLPLCPAGVGGHQVDRQRRDGQSVGADVMDRHGHHGVTRIGGHQRANRQLGGEIETPGGELIQSLIEIRCTSACFIGDRPTYPRRIVNHLPHSDTTDVGEHGPQRGVTHDDVDQRRGQGGHVDLAVQPQRERDVVQTGVGIESVTEPQSALGTRQRCRPRRRDRDDRRKRVGRRFCCAGGSCVAAGPGCFALPGDRRRDTGDGPSVEDGADRDIHAQFTCQPSCHLGGRERVAADRQEVVGRAHPVGAGRLGEDRCHRMLDMSARLDVVAAARQRF
ncbi:hypothetical protein GCM10027169_24280 [Gordonia jinhuaensis]